MTLLSHPSSRLLALKPTTGPGFRQYVDLVFVSYSALDEKILFFLLLGWVNLTQEKDRVKEKIKVKGEGTGGVRRKWGYSELNFKN